MTHNASYEEEFFNIMGCLRALLCIIFPPLSVIDRGCGTLLIVTILTIGGFWIAGVVAALIINYVAVQEARNSRIV